MIRLIFVYLFILPLVGRTQVAPERDVIICGHRGGYYAQYPENSLSLFQYVARQFSGDTVMLEIDLQKSKDGTLYILHDETLERTTNGRGRIDQTSDHELAKLSLKNGLSEVVNEAIPTFRSVLSFAQKNNVRLMLDIKKDIFKEVLEEVEQFKIAQRCLVLTFRWENSEKVATLQSGVQISCLITKEEDLKRLNNLSIPHQQKVAYVNQNTPAAIVAELKAKGILLVGDVSEHVRHQGTPLSPKEYREIVAKNRLDILVSDFPIEAKLGFE